jgi:hypothetical protein
MDMEIHLRRLESEYRAAQRATHDAKTRYLNLAGDPGASAGAVDGAKARWQELEARTRSLAAQMGEIETLAPSEQQFVEGRSPAREAALQLAAINRHATALNTEMRDALSCQAISADE